jgi:hypothetical protein
MSEPSKARVQQLGRCLSEGRHQAAEILPTPPPRVNGVPETMAAVAGLRYCFFVAGLDVADDAGGPSSFHRCDTYLKIQSYMAQSENSDKGVAQAGGHQARRRATP